MKEKDRPRYLSVLMCIWYNTPVMNLVRSAVPLQPNRPRRRGTHNPAEGPSGDARSAGGDPAACASRAGRERKPPAFDAARRHRA